MRPIPSYCNNSYEVDHFITRYFLNGLTLIEAPLSIFTAYCILAKTPSTAKQAKWFLLVHHIWVILFSNSINIGLSPIIFFPFIAGYFQGAFSYLPNPWTLDVVTACYAGLLSSLLVLFCYRHQLTLPPNHYLKINPCNLLIAVGIFHLLSLLFPLPSHLRYLSLNHEQDIESIRNVWEKPPCDLWNPNIMVFWFDVMPTIICYVVIVMIGAFLMVSFVGHSFYILNSRGVKVSENTKKRQRSYIIALILMSLIPNVLLTVPIMAIVAAEPGKTFSAEIGDVLMCTMSTHGIVSTITLIASHRHYRNHTIYIFRVFLGCRRGKVEDEKLRLPDSTTKYDNKTTRNGIEQLSKYESKAVKNGNDKTNF